MLKAHTLDQTMKNKVQAFLDRGEIRDCFDSEFMLRRGVELPFKDAGQSTGFQKKLARLKDRDFKVKLAQSRVERPWFVHKGIDETDPAGVYAHKVLDSTLDTIVRIRGSLNHAAIERAVDALAHAADAGRIVFFGLGASGAVAHDAACKFFFLVTQCHAYADGHMQHMCAPTLGPDDAVVAISGTGKTRDLVRNAGLARRSGATVIAITSPGSPLADVASILVAADVRENTDVYTPSISRIVHLLIVDILAVGVALRFSRRTEARVERIKRVVRASRLQGGETLTQDA